MRLLICALVAGTACAASIEGYWEGVMTSNGAETPLALEFTKQDDGFSGTLTMTEFGRLNHGFKTVEVERDSFNAVFGIENPLTFDGKLMGRGDKRTLTGVAAIGNRKLSFDLRPAAKPTVPYRVEEVTFTNGDVTLAGAVYAPQTPGRHAAVVVLHGSGDNPRWAYHEPADWFARHDVVCLIFDKRGNGKSSGAWRDVGFNELADDGIAGLRLLQGRPDVDPKRVGFWGISQAGWIMEAAAQRCPDTAFFISISGGTAQVEREGYFDYECMLRGHGFSEGDIAEAIDMLRRYNATVRSEQGYQEFLEWMQPLRQKPWFAKLEWVPRPPNAINQQWYRRVMDFDPEPILRVLDIPMLFVFGEADDSNPTGEGVLMLNKVKSDTGKDITVIAYPEADHGVRLPVPPNAPFPFRKRVVGFWPDQQNWLQSKGFIPE